MEAILIGTAWQRCRVHFLRNVLAQVLKGSTEMVAAAIRTIFAPPDGEHVRGQLDTVAGMLGRQLPEVESMLRDAAADITAFADFPVPHWKKIWPTNATYPKPLWLCSNPPPTQAINPLPSPPLSRHSQTHRASGETPARSARDCRAHR
jgi:putative transposase